MSDERMTAEVLKAARALIEDPKHWTQRVYARDAEGKAVNLFDARAECFCASGAIYRATDACGVPYQLGVEDMLIRAIGGASVPEFNDAHHHANVLGAFDRAIALAEQTP